MRVEFERIRCAHPKTGNCPVCGRRVTKSQTFEQTVNPFNRNEDGSVKTREQVRADVHAEAEAWQPDFRHEKCKEKEDA